LEHRQRQKFLGLSDDETTYVALRLRLADSLRRRRQKQNLSQANVARLGSLQPVPRRKDGRR
jgi:hypothetical protein